MRSLATSFPQAEFTSGADPQQLVVWARKGDHPKIKETIDKLTAPEPAETAKKAEVYKLKSVTASSAYRILVRSFPNVDFTPGDNAYELIAVARPAEHREVAQAIAELAKEVPEEEKPVPETYNLGGPVPATLLQSLVSAFPQAEFTRGAAAEQVVAWATKADHAKIKATIDKLTAPESDETAKKAVIYKLKSVTASGALSVLNRSFPNVVFSVGTDPYELIAVARPSEHQRIEQAVAELGERRPRGRKTDSGHLHRRQSHDGPVHTEPCPGVSSSAIHAGNGTRATRRLGDGGRPPGD